MISVTIEGVERKSVIDYSSLVITQALTNEPDSCSFIVKKFGSRTYVPSVEDEVIVTQDSTKIFAGYIIEVEEAYSTIDYVAYTVTVSDYAHILGAKLVVETYENQTVLEIIQDIKSKYLPSGITVNNVDVETNINYVGFNYEYVSDVLQQLADLVGADWYIDYDKDIHFNFQKTEDAPFNLSDTGGKYIYESLVIRRDITQLRNIVYVRGGEYVADTVTAIYDGNGSQAYFYLPYKMSDLTLTVTGAHKSVGVDPIDDPSKFDAMHNFQEKTLYFRSGRVPRNTSALSAANKIRIGGDPNIPVIVKLRDQDSIETFTAREVVIIDASIKSKEGARQRAAAELLTYRSTISEAEFDTYEEGLRTGQKILIQSTLRGIDNEEYIVNKVEWRIVGVDASDRSTKFVCHVSLVTTKTYGFTQLIQKLLNKEKKTLVIDETEVIDAVEVVEETATIADNGDVLTPSNPLVVESVDSHNGSWTGTSQNFTFNCPSGTNLLVVAVMQAAGGISSVSFNGSGLTEDIAEGANGARIFHLINPTSGSHTLAFSGVGSGGDYQFEILAISGIDTSDVVEATSSIADGDSSSLTKSATATQAQRRYSIFIGAGNISDPSGLGTKQWDPIDPRIVEVYDQTRGGVSEFGTTFYRIFTTPGLKKIGSTYSQTADAHRPFVFALFNGQNPET